MTLGTFRRRAESCGNGSAGTADEGAVFFLVEEPLDHLYNGGVYFC